MTAATGTDRPSPPPAVAAAPPRRRVVLYNPQAVFHTLPLALLAIGSALDRARYDVHIVDARLEADPHAALLAALAVPAGAPAPVCVGVTVLTGAPIRDALAASRAVKARHPRLPVVWGGWHPSLFPAATLAEPAVDVTVAGQGEVAFAALVDRLADGAAPCELGDLAGVSCRAAGSAAAGHAADAADATAAAAGADGAILSGPPRPLAPVDGLPPHDYELLPLERYFAAKGQRQLDYVASAGCLFRCAFCADPFVYGRRWSGLAPERVGEEAERWWRRYGFTELAFQDETFFTYKQHAVGIAEALLRRGLRFAWTATLRADQAMRLDEEMLALCVRSGLRRVMVGVESGSQEMLDWMEKDVTVEQVLLTAERCRRHGLGAIFPFIVGFPGESEASVDATLALVRRLRRMSPDFETPIFYFKPYPGSRLTADAVRAGHRLPETLEEWAEFDFVGSSGPWVSRQRERRVERFKFYNRMAYGRGRAWHWPAKALARWRLERGLFALPLEKALIERLRPLPRLS